MNTKDCTIKPDFISNEINFKSMIKENHTMNITDSMLNNFIKFIKSNFLDNFPAMDYVLIGTPEEQETFINTLIISDYFHFKNQFTLNKLYRIALLPNVTIDETNDAAIEVNGHKFYSNLIDGKGLKIFLKQNSVTIESNEPIPFLNCNYLVLFTFRLSEPKTFLDHYGHLFIRNGEAVFRGARAYLIKWFYGNEAKDVGNINRKLTKLLEDSLTM